MTEKEIKTSYAKFLLPKLEWATSEKCKNIRYAQKRLRDAIICIEDLINTIQSISVEEANSSTVEVMHTHWIENCDGAELQLVCNQCGYDYIEADPDYTERHNFCPHCGAKMDEEVKG